MIVEVVGGVLTGSLALLADAAHMLTDAAAISLAFFAMWISGRPASAGSTFGPYRTEVLAALANTVSLWLIAARSSSRPITGFLIRPSFSRWDYCSGLAAQVSPPTLPPGSSTAPRERA